MFEFWFQTIHLRSWTAAVKFQERKQRRCYDTCAGTARKVSGVLDGQLFIDTQDLSGGRSSSYDHLRSSQGESLLRRKAGAKR